MPDTSVVVELFRDENAPVKERFKTAGQVYLCAIVLRELYFGAQKSARVVENMTQIYTWATAHPVLSLDGDTARLYAQVRDGLRRKDKPIPENDIWIAASAIQHGLTLATRAAHFGEVDGLSVEFW